MLPFIFFIVALGSGFALAQNDTTATNTTICSNQWDTDGVATGPINSTGSESLFWNSTTGGDRGAPKPWYISVLVNDTGNTLWDNGGTTARPYLSVPNDVNANVCVYSFASRNATSIGNGSGDIGCAGVLPEGCIAYLRGAIMNETSEISGSRARCDMLSLAPEDQKRREEACGPLGSMGLRCKSSIPPFDDLHLTT